MEKQQKERRCVSSLNIHARWWSESGCLRRERNQKGMDSDTNSGSNGGTNVAPKKKTSPQYVIELQVEQVCGDHTVKYCLIRPNGNNYHLTKADLTLWSLLLVSCIILFRE